VKIMKAAILASLASAHVLITPEISASFMDFQAKYGKSYSDEEFPKRMVTFAENLVRAQRDNQEHMLAAGTAVFGVTKFMDLSPEEFKNMYLTYIPPSNRTLERVVPRVKDVAAAVDWVAKGVTTPVKDQAQCGSCWAFSATEAIESYAKLSGKYDLKSLSAQQITSCDKKDLGCNGGNTETAYEYVVKAGGIETSADYPYTSGTGRTGTCQFEASKVAVKITGYKSVAAGESHLEAALNDGPVSICLAATKFQSYTGGILSVCDNNVDHCVQGVGYNLDGATPYWTVRNSWGTGWGERGYIRIAKGKDLCKIADDVTYPTF
jgi:C1A family cysteine protease